MSVRAGWAWVALVLILPFVAGIIFTTLPPRSSGSVYDSAAIARIISEAE